MPVLVDTSIWIDYLRGVEPAAGELERLVADREVVCCGPVLAELVTGTVLAQRDEVVLSLAALPLLDLGPQRWIRAGALAHELRSRGTSVPLIDLLIAVAAVEEDAELWTRDGDFEQVAAAEHRLRLYRPRDER
ncbi:MAG: type II toxin-antitoxin system VapC family toxin [Gaiellaceae bacterium]